MMSKRRYPSINVVPDGWEKCGLRTMNRRQRLTHKICGSIGFEVISVFFSLATLGGGGYLDARENADVCEYHLVKGRKWRWKC